MHELINIYRICRNFGPFSITAPGTPVADSTPMKNLYLALGLTAALFGSSTLAGCSTRDALEIPEGSEVTVERTDGVSVSGRLVEVKSEQIVVEGRDGLRTNVPRAQIASMRSVTTPATLAARKADEPAPLAPEAQPAPSAPMVDDSAGAAGAAAAVETPRAVGSPRTTTGTGMRDVAETSPRDRDDEAQRRANRATRTPEYREVTVPSGTTLSVELTTGVASDTSQVEDAVRGRVRQAIRIDGVEAVPAGSTVIGNVTSAQPAAKVKGQASIGFRFNTIDLPGDGGRERISTATYSRVAGATKKKDATKIGVGAGAGAIIGGILGGGSGAAKGAVIGGGAGTAVVLGTKGDEVGLPAGTPVTIRLTAPLTVRIRQ